MIPTTPPVVTLLDLLPADVWGGVGRFVEARGLAAACCRTLYDAVRGGAGRGRRSSASRSLLFS